MIVADASVVVDLLLGPPSEAGGEELARRLARREAVAAPHLLDAEVGQVLRRLVHGGSLGAEAAVERLADLADLPIERYPHRDLVLRAFDLRDNVTVYDGLYLALSEVLEAPLLTGDARLADVPGCRAEVVVAAV